MYRVTQPWFIMSCMTCCLLKQSRLNEIRFYRKTSHRNSTRVFLDSLSLTPFFLSGNSISHHSHWIIHSFPYHPRLTFVPSPDSTCFISLVTENLYPYCTTSVSSNYYYYYRDVTHLIPISVLLNEEGIIKKYMWYRKRVTPSDTITRVYKRQWGAPWRKIVEERWSVERLIGTSKL